MKVVYCAIWIFTMNFTLQSQVSNIKWIKTAMGSEDEWPRIVKTDLEGNVYVVGEFDSNNILIEGVNLENKADTTLNNQTNLFVIKYSSQAILKWVKVFQSDGALSTVQLGIRNNETIAISCDFGVGTYLMYDNREVKFPKNLYGSIIFYIDELGKLIWYKTFQDNISSSGTAGIIIDNQGDVLFGGTTASGTIKDESGNYLIKDSIRENKAFLFKFDKSGKIIWTKVFGSHNFDYLSAITTDNLNNIIIHGSFMGPFFEIDNYKILNKSKKGNFSFPWDNFLAKLDPAGNTIWLNLIYGSKDDYSADKIATDNENNIFLAGGFDSDTIYFNENVKLLKSNNPQNYYDLFYTKYKSNGELQWARKLDNGVVGGLDFITLTVSTKGQLFLAGNYDNTGFRSGEIVLPSYGLNDIFYFECNTEGDIISKGSLGSDDHEWITDIHLDNQSNLYLLGTFGSNELKLGNTTLSNTSRDRSTDMYLIKICPDSLISTSNPNVEQNFEVVYFPDHHKIRIVGIEKHDKCQLSIFNVSGQLIFSKVINGSSEYITIPNLISGVYFASIRSGSEVLTSKFFIISF